MSTNTRVHAYASALFEVARAEGALDTVEEELFRVARTFEGSDELRSTLTDQAIPVEMRQGIVEQLLGDRASPVTTSLVSFVVGAGRARDLPAIIDRLVEEAADQRDEVVAEVRSAVPLDVEQKTRLAAALSEATKKKVSVKVIEDPSVLGGLIATIGDTVIDGSIRHRLDQMKESL
ncbi:MAG TPA: ATP synthase F1 subunit delta [Acidimicrobiales bacterium]|nr:ATP synthase F1 subunit delta [Acidimicrobiales bacterium]